MAPQSESKISRDVAENEFERFCTAQRVDLETDDFDEDDLKSFEQQKNRIIKAICRGSLIVNDKSEAVFNHDNGTVTFKQPKASCLLAMDRAKKGHDMKAMFDLMADICEVAPATFAKMHVVDCKTCLAVTTLFLGS